MAVSTAGMEGTGDLKTLPEMEERHRLEAFLHGLPASVLAEKLMQMADSDFAIARELQCWRRSSEVACDPAELEDIVARMLAPGRHYIKLGEGREYVRRGEAVLPLLRQTCARDAQVAVTLGFHALRCAWELSQQADDSGDEFGELCRAIGAEWLTCLHAAGAQPAAFGESYLQLVLDDPDGSFDTDEAGEAMGEAARQSLRQALQRRWRAGRKRGLAARVGTLAPSHGRTAACGSSSACTCSSWSARATSRAHWPCCERNCRRRRDMRR
jgi:hypothetical protein